MEDDLKSRDLCEPVWSEGMFLTPHHLQYWQRNLAAQQHGLTQHLAVFTWGFQKLELELEALGEFNLKIASCRAILPEGQVLAWPGNLELSSRSFKELMPAQGGLTAYLGVPEFRPDQANLYDPKHPDQSAGSPPFLPLEVEELDTNTGQTPRKILVKKFRGRLFFGDEDRTGYQCLPLARLLPGPGGAGARLDPGFMPPVLTTGAWEPLRTLGQEISSRIQATLGALEQGMGQEEASELVGSTRGLESLLKHLALAGPGQVLAQLARTPSLSPYLLYLELCRLQGTLSAFQGAMTLKPPPAYDHHNPGPCFQALRRNLEAMLERLASPSYLRRSFVLKRDRLQVDLNQDWVSGRRHLYLGVSGNQPPEDMKAKVAGIKICAPRDLEEVRQRRLGAIPIEWLSKAPSPLPGRGKILYGRITAGGPFWAGVQEDLALDILGHEDVPYRFDLYVV